MQVRTFHVTRYLTQVSYLIVKSKANNCLTFFDSNSSVSRPTLNTDLNPGRSTKMMHNFGYILPDVCIGSLPTKQDHITTLEKVHNVGLVVTLTKESPLPMEMFAGQLNIRNLFAPVKNYDTPTIQEVDSWLEEIRHTIVDRQKNVFIHCRGGNGRSGTLAACCLLKWGFDSIGEGEELRTQGKLLPQDLNNVIKYIRKKRPRSIETKGQELFLKKYAEHLWQIVDKEKEGSKNQDKSEGGLNNMKRITEHVPNIGNDPIHTYRKRHTRYNKHVSL